MGADLADEVLGVAGLADDLEAVLGEQPDDPLAQQHRVLGDDYSHGILAITVVPAPGGEVDLELAAERRDPVGEAAQPAAPGRVRAADAVVGDLDHARGRSSRSQTHRPPGWRART